MSWLRTLEERLTGGDLQFDAMRDAVVSAEEGPGPSPSEVEALIAAFQQQRDILRDKIGTYPGNAVNAKDWLDGVGLGHLAVRLATVLEQAESFEAEFLARELAVNIGCIVEGHYHHVIGPRMVALIRSADQLGRVQHVEALCDAVVNDFMWILANALEETEAPGPEDALSIWSLQFALEREAQMPTPPHREFSAADAAAVLARTDSDA